MPISFYTPEDGRFASSEFTRGPWDPLYQHAGPPAALLGHAIESLDGGRDFMVGRFTMEILRGVPLRALRVDARLTRAGRRVQLAEATLGDDDGVIAQARAWRIRRGDTREEQSVAEPGTFPPPGEVAPAADFDPWGGPSYFSAVEWRVAAGDFMKPGPATVWMRLRGQLVAGEEPSPLTRVLVAADSGNGVSMELPLQTHVFINTELTVHLHREPVGEWVCLEARTRIGPAGAGVATSTLFDTAGRFGTANQCLLVRPR